MSADPRALCIVAGSEVASALAHLLNLSPSFRAAYKSKAIFSDNARFPLTPERITDEDAVETQLVIFEAPFGDVAARFPAATPRISFPPPRGPALWPMHCADPRNTWEEMLFRTASDPPILDPDLLRWDLWYAFFPCPGVDERLPPKLGPDGLPVTYPYGDAYVLRLLDEGVSKREIIARYLALDVAAAADLDALVLRSHQAALDAERTTDVKLADIVRERFAHERLFAAIDRPTNQLLVAMANQILANLGWPPLGAYPIRALADLMGIPAVPLHPALARHFGLPYADGATRYTVDAKRLLTFEEYVDQYVDFAGAPEYV